jgi:hypothetical protein
MHDGSLRRQRGENGLSPGPRIAEDLRMMRTAAAAFGATSFAPRTLGLALGLALAAATASADEPGRTRAGFDSDRPAARVFLAGANRDTLPYDWRDAYPVAVAALEHDNWTIQRADTAEGRIVTRWKPLQHVLARLLLGQVMARCVVDLKPLRDGRSVLTIQGGLASDQDLAASSGYGAAQAIYHGAAGRWADRVRRELDDRARRGLVERVAAAAERPPAHLEN